MGVIYSLRKAILGVRICNVRVVIFLLSLLLIRIQQTFSQVQVTEEWVARYNGPGSAIDTARSIVVDSLGNVYVTGYSYGGDRTGYDFATISYDSSGNERWVARYNGLSYYGDEALAITTDSSGNVYVTGYSYYGRETGYDYTTVSYNSSGKERWVARYNGPTNSDDIATAIATDLYGNVYVTGYSASIGTGIDYATVSYDSSGNERWVARYNGPVNFDDIAYAIAIDLSGNVYVTGQSWGDRTSVDYATVSYDSSGNERWVARYNGPVNRGDGARAIDTDSSGNIYVTGISIGSEIGLDYATISYDSSGNERWVTRYHDNPVDPGGVVGVIAIVTDLSGNVYVTGTSWWNYWVSDYMTVSYDSLGNERWVARYHTPGLRNRAYDMVTDSSGNVYVTGSSGYDYATVKYSQMVKLPLGNSIEEKADPGRFRMYVPSRYGGELTVSVVDSTTGFPTGSVDLFYPDFNTQIPSNQDINPAPSIFKYEVPVDKFGWYYVKVTGSTNYIVSNTFIEKGEVLPERKPWNISTWWPFSDVYDFGDSLTTEDDNYTIQEIKSLDDSVFPKYDAACGLSGSNSAAYWETAKSVLEEGHYIYNGEDRETHAEFDWKHDWNGVNGIENPGPYDFFSDTPGEGLFYSDGDLNDTYNSTWWGHCNGWAIASIIFQDPTLLQLRNGFIPEEVKGLLTEIGMKRTLMDYIEQKPDKDEGTWTKEFHDFLRDFIKDKKLTVWGNLKSTARKSEDVDEVWNHPIWYYEASMKERPPQEGEVPNERLVDIILSLKAADDLGGNVREDSTTTGSPWKYYLMYDKNGKIYKSGSGWDTYAVDDPTVKYFIPYLIHPKFAPNIFIGQGGANPHVTEDRIKTNVVYGDIRRQEW